MTRGSKKGFGFLPRIIEKGRKLYLLGDPPINLLESDTGSGVHRSIRKKGTGAKDSGPKDRAKNTKGKAMPHVRERRVHDRREAGAKYVISVYIDEKKGTWNIKEHQRDTVNS